jgi:MFS family permease
MRGRYMAAFGMTISLPTAVGPLAAGIILDNYEPRLLWGVAAAVCAAAAGAFYGLHRKLRRDPRFHAVPAAPPAGPLMLEA